MAQIKRTKIGLDKINASVVDIDASSLFDIFVPKQLRAGKNEIRIRLVNDRVLVKGSEVLIDILDSQSEPLFYEVSEIANEDKTRSIIVSIFDTDLTGKAKFYLFAKLSDQTSYLSIINLEVNSELETQQEIKLLDPPIVNYTERKLGTQTFSNVTRQTSALANGGQISTISPIIPRQFSESTFVVEKQEVRELKGQNSVTNNQGSGSTLQLPTYFEPAIIRTDNFNFSSSFKGGTLIVNNITLTPPSDAINLSEFTLQNYSASILRVVSTSSIEVYPPYYSVIEYQTSAGKKTKVYDRFNLQSNFTCSYFQPLTLSQTAYTQSYAVFDIQGLETVAGKIDSIDVSYKNLSLIGDNYQPLGNFKVRSENILVDSGSLYFDEERGIIQNPIGTFKSGLTDFQNYWLTSSNNSSVSKTDSVPNGIKISGYDLLVQPKQQYLPKAIKGSELEITFDFTSQPSASFQPQLDVYISGSSIIGIEPNKNILLAPLQSSSFGNYVGSVNKVSGQARFVFEVTDNAVISPKFAFRRGFWSVGNIQVRTHEKVGYNVNQTRILAPMNLPTGSEVNFKLDYVNPVGKKLSTFSTVLNGVYFEGSFKPVSGSSAGSATIPAGTVSGSDQLTSSYDARYERRGNNIISSSTQISSLGFSNSGSIGTYTTYTASTNARLDKICLLYTSPSPRD